MRRSVRLFPFGAVILNSFLFSFLPSSPLGIPRGGGSSKAQKADARDISTKGRQKQCFWNPAAAKNQKPIRPCFRPRADTYARPCMPFCRLSFFWHGQASSSKGMATQGLFAPLSVSQLVCDFDSRGWDGSPTDVERAPEVTVALLGAAVSLGVSFIKKAHKGVPNWCTAKCAVSIERFTGTALVASELQDSVKRFLHSIALYDDRPKSRSGV